MNISSKPEVMEDILKKSSHDKVSPKALIDKEDITLRELKGRVRIQQNKISKLKRKYKGQLNQDSSIWLMTQVAQYKALTQKYESIIIHSADKLEAITKTVYTRCTNKRRQETCTCKGKVWTETGTYKITFDLNPRSELGPLLIVPAKGNTKSHPAVYGGGEFCSGDQSTQIYGMIRDRRWVEALMLLDRWFRTYSHGCSAGYGRKLTQDEITKLKAQGELL